MIRICNIESRMKDYNIEMYYGEWKIYILVFHIPIRKFTLFHMDINDAIFLTL